MGWVYHQLYMVYDIKCPEQNIWRLHQYKDPAQKELFVFSACRNYLVLQFFFYGMGESRLGNGPSSWILHMAFIILVANMWGLFLKEWSGVSKKTLTTIIAGIIIIIASVLLVGYGNGLK